jgi:hypothetical protein
MKKIFLVLFILISSFLFFSLMKVKAQGIHQLSLPGLNCGYAGQIGKDSCCKIEHPEIAIPNDFNSRLMALLPWTPIINLVNKFRDEQMGNLVSGGLICQFGVPDDQASASCKCINAITPSPAYLGALNDFCQHQSKLDDRNSCLQCANGGGVWSGIGCVKTDFKGFIEETVFGIGIGLAGGFSLLCIIYAAFMIQSSQGNPEKLKKAQELITSCIMGLMLIIFSVFILKLIGVNILRIPGFG